MFEVKSGDRGSEVKLMSWKLLCVYRLWNSGPQAGTYKTSSVVQVSAFFSTPLRVVQFDSCLLPVEC